MKSLKLFKQWYYQIMAEMALLKKQGNEFQDFVNDIFGYCYGSDFVRIKPHGRDGDFKCDGRIPKEGIIFQCYAPENMAENLLINKINKDYKGALKEWPDTRKWIFIHNGAKGIYPRVSQTLDALVKGNPNVKIEVWDRQKIEIIISKLEESYLIKMFGCCPHQNDFNSVNISDVQNMGHIVKELLNQRPEFDNYKDMDPTVPSTDKLEKNKLSQCAIDFIRQGRLKSSLVEAYLMSFPEPDFAEKTAQKFKDKYEILKKSGYNPDQIFGEICVFLGSNTFSSPKEVACMYSYMAYFFDRCSIFEDF